MDDLRARLDAAITETDKAITRAVAEGRDGAAYRLIEQFGDLRELRARWDEHRAGHSPTDCGRCLQIKADVRRVLGETVDGPTEAESARTQDQSSG